MIDIQQKLLKEEIRKQIVESYIKEYTSYILTNHQSSTLYIVTFDGKEFKSYERHNTQVLQLDDLHNLFSITVDTALLGRDEDVYNDILQDYMTSDDTIDCIRVGQLFLDEDRFINDNYYKYMIKHIINDYTDVFKVYIEHFVYSNRNVMNINIPITDILHKMSIISKTIDLTKSKLEIELHDLSTKLLSLDMFMSSDKFNMIKSEQQVLIIEQRHAMIEYKTVLVERLERW